MMLNSTRGYTHIFSRRINSVPIKATYEALLLKDQAGDHAKHQGNGQLYRDAKLFSFFAFSFAHNRSSLFVLFFTHL